MACPSTRPASTSECCRWCSERCRRVNRFERVARGPSRVDGERAADIQHHEGEGPMNCDTEAMAIALYEEGHYRAGAAPDWESLPASAKADWTSRAGALIQRYITTCERRATRTSSNTTEG